MIKYNKQQEVYIMIKFLWRYIEEDRMRVVWGRLVIFSEGSRPKLLFGTHKQVHSKEEYEHIKTIENRNMGTWSIH